MITEKDLISIGVPAEVARRVAGPGNSYAQIKRSLYQQRRYAGGTAITANTQTRYFQYGIGDQATNLGFTTGQLTLEQTNMQKEGRVPEQEIFVVFGLSNEFNSDIDSADLESFKTAYEIWEYNAGNRNLRFGQMAEIPAVYVRGEAFGSGDLAGQIDRPYLAGPPFVQESPLLVLLGSQFVVEQGNLTVTFPTTFTPSADVLHQVRLHGVHFQQY